MEDVPELEQARERLLAAVARELEETAGQSGCAGLDSRLAAALRRVPRHALIDQPQERLPTAPAACHRSPTDLAALYRCAHDGVARAAAGGHTVLEIGTGSEYQPAVLVCLARQVYGIEVISQLATAAPERLLRLDFMEIREGGHGLPAAHRLRGCSGATPAGVRQPNCCRDSYPMPGSLTARACMREKSLFSNGRPKRDRVRA